MAQAVIELSSLDGSNGLVLNGISPGDVSGVSVSSAGDVNGDGIDDVIVGAPGANANGDNSGQSYVVFGKRTGFDASLDLSDLNGINGFSLNGKGGGLGGSVSGAGDVNGDGFDDLVVGAGGVAPPGSNYYGYGESYIVFGAKSGIGSSFDLVNLDGTNGFTVGGGAVSFFGSSVSGAGDINGDHIDDVIIGAPDQDWLGFPGHSHIILGSKNGFAARPGNTGFHLSGFGYFGQSVSSAGDVNGDGIDDVIIGAPNALLNGYQSGKSYVFFGSESDFPKSSADLDGTNGFALNGGAKYQESGASVSGAGDVNGDGFDDVIVGAPGASPNGKYHSGRSYVVFGSSGGFPESLKLHDLDGTNGFALNGVGGHSHSGSSVSAAGDVNNDGLDDVIVGAPWADANGNSSGKAFVVFGSASGFAPSLDLLDLDGSDGFVLNGVAGLDYSGTSVSAAGDVNGDGIDDLIIGADGADPNGKSSGQSYVVFGFDSPGGKTLAGSPQADVLSGTLSADTISGNNGHDMLKGWAGADMLRGGAHGDTVKGGGGDDTMGGGGGKDMLTGNKGDDRLRGGADSDTFVFRAAFGADQILDFDADRSGGQDRIDLQALGISAATFDDFVIITDLGSNTRVTVEDFGAILLEGVNGDEANELDASDFLLLA